MCPSIHKDLFRDIPFNQARLIVTARGLYSNKKARRALRRILPYARIHKTGFRSVYVIETHGNVLHIAEKIIRRCLDDVGHATAVVEEVQTDINNIKEAMVSAGSQLIKEYDSYCIRIKRRGSYFLDENIQALEADIGGEIWKVLKEKYGKEPRVDLENPDIKIIAEVLGHATAIGVQYKSWFEEPYQEEISDTQ
ncbi:MAG TPA: THUMP domain-containing protein [Balneolales bacterium]|nr:THUMP domain-containing protein [Balneolales bacterium]